MSAPSGRRLELAASLPVPAAKVWSALTEPRHVAGWFTDRAEGKMEPGATFTWHWDSMGISVPNAVTAVEPDKSFELTFGSRSLLVRLVGGAGSRTGLKLVNTGLPDDDDGFQSVRSGWLLSIALLRKYLTEFWDRPKQQVFIYREAQFDFARVIDYYRLPKREEWLGGAPPVLEDSGTEVALDWVERQGVLELKAFAHGDKRFLGMRATSWDGESMEVWPGAIAEALDRLLPLVS